MRVFCPTHRRSFPAPRKNPIKCEHGTHVMGEIDFAGRALEPAAAQWAYCSDCEHFWPINPDVKMREACPVCERPIAARFLCHRCYTLTVESDSPADVKNFTMTKQGVPQPSCPTCLKEVPQNASLHEHSCEVLGASFITPLDSCPSCEELIAAAPAFPSSVSDYLNKVKARKRAKFSYENDLLVADEGGEFVLVPNGKEQSLVLPELIRFTTKQDFYDFYENHFHCENPAPGEVIILYPAIAQRAEGGWTLKEMGRLKVTAKPSEAVKEKALFNTLPSEETVLKALGSVRAKQPAPAPVKAEQPESGGVVKCPRCASMMKATDMFCWKCGEALGNRSRNYVTSASDTLPARKEAVAVPTKPVKPLSPPSSPPLIRSSILDPTPPEAETQAQEKRVGAILLVGLLGLIAIGSILWLVLSLTSPVNSNQVMTNVLPKQTNTQNSAPSVAANTPATSSNPATQNAENDLKTLQEKSKNAGRDERPELLKEYEAAEKKYAQDYRFPYERAKLLVETHGHGEAFRALFIAGEKALDNGKSAEMLSELERDGDADFKRLAKGHREWDTLLSALKSGDKRALRNNT